MELHSDDLVICNMVLRSLYFYFKNHRKSQRVCNKNKFYKFTYEYFFHFPQFIPQQLLM